MNTIEKWLAISEGKGDRSTECLICVAKPEMSIPLSKDIS